MKELTIIIEKLKEGKELITKISDYHSSTNKSLKQLSKNIPKSIPGIERLQLEYIGIQSYYVEELEKIRKLLWESDLRDEIPIDKMIENIDRFVKISKESIETVKESLTNINRYLRDNNIEL